jgi:hypothetical protein
MSIIPDNVADHQDNSENSSRFCRTTLINSVDKLPSHWALTPVADKKPLRIGWNTEAPIEHSQLKVELESSQWNGYGLRLGDVSGGLLALDVDGPSALSLLKAIQGTYESLPNTVTWTSGKEGRSQILFRVPNHYREKFNSFNRKDLKEFSFNGEKIKCTGNEAVDFRYNTHQSVLPPSAHPETGIYHWINSLNDCEVAIAPDWLCEFILGLLAPKNKQKHKPLKREYSNFNDIDKNILDEWIDATPLDSLDWYEYRNLLFALHNEGYSESDALSISQTSSKHTNRGFYSIWKNIKDNKGNNITGGTLHYFAVNYGGWKSQKPRKPYKFNNLLTQKIEDKKEYPRYPKGFGAIKQEGIHVKKEEIPSFILSEIRKGRYVKVGCIPGQGKTHDVEYLVNLLQGDEQIIYATKFHRKPPTDYLASVPDIPARNKDGYILNEKGERVAATKDTPEDEKTEKGNCENANLFGISKEKGHNPYGSGGLSPICKECSVFEKCISQRGGYLHDKTKILTNPDNKIVRTHLDSIERNKDNSNKILVIDEMDQQHSPVLIIEANKDEITLDSEHYRAFFDDDQWAILDGIKIKIQNIINRPFVGHNYHGLKHDEVLTEFDVTNTDELENILGIMELNSLDFSVYMPTKDGYFFDGLSEKEDRKYQSMAGNYINEVKRLSLSKMPPNVMVNIVRALLGKDGITIRAESKKIRLTIDDRSQYSHIQDYKGVIILDGSKPLARLQKELGIDKEIIAIHSEETAPYSNLTFNHSGIDLNSAKLRDSGMLRVKAWKAEKEAKNPDMSFITHKAWSEVDHSPETHNGITKIRRSETMDVPYWYGKHDIGTNEFVGHKKLGIMFLNRPNLGDVYDRYLCLYGTEDGWEEYYQELINANLFQNIGRLRAQRQPDDTFHIEALLPDDYDSSWLQDGWGINVTHENAYEVSLDCATITQIALNETASAIFQLIMADQPITQNSIAKLRGVSQQAIAKLLPGKDFVKTIKNTTLGIKDSYTKGCILLSEFTQQLESYLCKALGIPKIYPVKFEENLETQPSEKIVDAEIIDKVDLEDDFATAPTISDIPDRQNKVNLDGQNSVVDIHTEIALKGAKIKDKVTGEVFIVESFAKGRYHCIDGKYRLSIPFDDAIAA